MARHATSSRDTYPGATPLLLGRHRGEYVSFALLGDDIDREECAGEVVNFELVVEVDRVDAQQGLLRGEPDGQGGHPVVLGAMVLEMPAGGSCGGQPGDPVVDAAGQVHDTGTGPV